MGEGQMPSPPERPVRLRQAREAAGLHIAALAAALKVPVRKLEALEAGRYDELPDLTFARALASSACRQLKVNPGPVLEQIPQNPAPALGESDNALNTPFKGASDAPPSSPLSWLSRPALLGAIALLLAALVVLFLPRLESTPEPATPAPAQVPAAPAAAPAVPLFQPGAPEAPGGGLPVPATPAAPDAGGEQTQAPADAAPDSGATTGAPATPVVASADTGSAPAGGAVLRLEARGESWAEVTNGTGTVVLQRLMQPGERVEFSAAPPYAVVLGNAREVQVTLRGKRFDASALARNNVARFEAP